MNLTGAGGRGHEGGLGSNLTLEATINPDFGQIEADPAEVNLTVFETTFSERRPFFIEGNNVLEAGTSNYYYSRRIGARPTGPASGDFVDYPDTATILGAAKMTGRLGSGTSIGFLAALTAEEFAHTSTGGVESKVAVAPTATWAVGRVIQELDDQGSTVGAHVTMVHRNLDASDPLASSLQPQRHHHRCGHAPAVQGPHLRGGLQRRLHVPRRRAGGHRPRAARKRALPAAPRPAGHPLRPDAHDAGRDADSGQLQQDRGPPLAVGLQHDDREPRVRPARLRPVELRGRLHRADRA